MSDAPTSNPPDRAAALAIATACGLGISFGSLDLVFNIWPGGSVFGRAHFVLPPMRAAGVFFALAYLGSLLALWLPAIALGWKKRPLAIGCAVVVTVVGLWCEAYYFRPSLQSWLLRLSVFLNLGMVATAYGLSAWHGRPRGGGGNRWKAMLLIPAALAIVGTYAIFNFDALEAKYSFPRMMLGAKILFGTTLSIVAVATGRIVYRFAATSQNDSSSGKDRWPLALTLLPLLLAGVAGGCWIFKIHGEGTVSKALGLYLALSLGALAPVSGFGKFAGRRVRGGVLLLGMLLVIAAPEAPAIRHTWSTRAIGTVPSSARAPKHILLITVDTLRADVLSCYGPDGAPTPNIDALAEDGIIFRHAQSPASWTLPSFATLMTGLSPTAHSATTMNARLPAEAKTLAEYLAEAGYYTGGIGRNPYLRPARRIGQGFIDYEIYPKSRPGRSFGTQIIHRLDPGFYKVKGSTTDIREKAVDWIDRHHERDFFFWCHFLDPHEPYEPPAEYYPPGEPPYRVPKSAGDFTLIRKGLFSPSEEQKQWASNLYLAELRYVDDNFGLLIERLKQLGIYDDALIIFTSDHGEELWDRGGCGHGHTLHNEVINVPLIVKLPQSSVKKSVTQIVSNGSLLATTLDLAQIDYDPDWLSSGSLVPTWQAEESTSLRTPVVSTGILFGQQQEAVLFDGYKFTRKIKSGKQQLYDLGADPEERHSITESRPEVVETAMKLLLAYHERSIRLRHEYGIGAEAGMELDAETLEHLKSLGYIE